MPKIIYNPLTSDFDYINKSTDFKGNFKPSSGIWAYVSAQVFSGGRFYHSGSPATDFELVNKKFVDDTAFAAGAYTDSQARDAIGTYAGLGLTYNAGSEILSVSNYIASSSAISHFADSANIRFRFIGSSQGISRFAPSKSVSNGIFTVVDGSGAISHGLIGTPNNWSLRPSGNINFGITTKVDATKIYVNLTTRGSRIVYWYAST